MMPMLERIGWGVVVGGCLWLFGGWVWLLVQLGHPEAVWACELVRLCR